MALRLASAALLLLCSVEAANLRLPSDVGSGGNNQEQGAACTSVIGETKQACAELSNGQSNKACNFAVCYTADLNRARCASVVTVGAPTNVVFPADLDKLKTNHAISCSGGAQGGAGVRNARFDCGAVAASGMWNGASALLQEFADKYPASMKSSGLDACLTTMLQRASSMLQESEGLAVFTQRNAVPVNTDKQYATSADSTKTARTAGYRAAWDDCGGVGASATERMRSIAAKIKGWAKPLPFVRHAAQDCGSGAVAASGLVPGPGTMVVYPGPETLAKLRDGKAKAAATLAKYVAR